MAARPSGMGKAGCDGPGLGDVVDVRLTPQRRPDETRSAVSYNHHYPVLWYAATVRDRQARSGFGWSVINGFDPGDLEAGYLVTGNDRLVKLPDRADSDAAASNPAYVVETVIGAVTELSARHPDVLVAVDVGEDALLVEFDYEIQRGGRHTRLEAAVNHSLTFTASPRYQVPARGRFLDLPAGSGGRVQVQFRLANPGLLGSATVGRLRVVRGQEARRNLDDLQAMKVSALLGAAAGAGAAFAVVGVISGVRRLARGPC